MFSKYDKLLVALLGALATVAVQYYGTNKYVQIGVAVVTALGVYQIPNKVA